MNVNEKLRAEDGTKPANARWYRSMVGGLNYLSNTRPDIAHYVVLMIEEALRDMFFPLVQVLFHGARRSKTLWLYPHLRLKIYCDNKSAIVMTKNAAFHGRIKHIDIRYHFIRDLIADGVIALKYCGTKEQVADIMTKSLLIGKVEDFRIQMGVCCFEAGGSVK
ncbi:uncharacterized protein LOC114713402 [Neltuma alba]|uniref:uncharacterized protein LOC114713402 n=1 Tax=Neltuma alba TaxID=207710 RepID=UPI0010A2F820|nr:uncharacterized protein LOC114713402 [Prosopis alba]